MDAALRAVVLITVIGVIARADDIPRAVSTLAEVHVGLAVLGVLALAVSSAGLVQLWRLRRSGLLIARAMGVVSILLVVTKYWTSGTLSSVGLLSLAWQVALTGLLFLPPARRACGGAPVGIGSGPTTA